MEAYDVLAIALSSLIMLIVIHISVFALVRWMYPPQMKFVEAPIALPPPLPFTQPPIVKQEINVPTYTPPVLVETTREEGRTEPGDKQSTAAERPSWLVAVDPKTLDQ